MSNSFDDFLHALRARESSGNYSVVNIYGFLGAYQFGEAALVDLGFVRLDGDPYDNDFSGGWTGRYGIDSTAEFLASPEVQDAAALEWFELVWGYCLNLGLDQYLGQTVGGILVTASGILGGAHLLGPQAVLAFLESGGVETGADQFGTPVSEYMSLFSGYRMPFETGEVWIDNPDAGGPDFILVLPGDPVPDEFVAFPVELSTFCFFGRSAPETQTETLDNQQSLAEVEGRDGAPFTGARFEPGDAPDDWSFASAPADDFVFL